VDRPARGTAAVLITVVRRAAAQGMLAPLVVGIALRLVVMLVAHADSVSLGDHGVFYLDDQTYLHGASVLADDWRAGRFPNPARYDILGTYQFGYQLFLAAIFTLCGGTSILLGKLANVLFGGVTVYLVGRLGGRLLGDRAKVQAAWVAALAPSMIWWSAPLLKEALATMLLALGLLAVTALPQRRALVTLAAVVALLAPVRAPAALALVVGAAVAVAIAGRKAEGRLISRPLISLGATLLVGLIAVVLVVSRGSLSSFYLQYDTVIQHMFNVYGGGSIIDAPFNAAKSLVTPLPWVFDSGTRNWDRMLYPGVWLLICALPLAAAGSWRLRRSPEGWALMAAAGSALLLNAATGGFPFRQRSMLEPLILLLALAGAKSWCMAARSAAATLAVVAIVAGIQSRSPAVTLAIAAAAGALFLVSRRLPGRPSDPLLSSPMVASFRRSAESRSPATHSTTTQPPGERPRVLRLILVAMGQARSAVVRVAPSLQGPDAQGAASSERAFTGVVKAALDATRHAAPNLDDEAHTLAASRLAPLRAALYRAAPRVHGRSRSDQNGGRR
jgi:hypothetical protein